MSMCPMVGRVKRSTTRSASVAGQPAHVEPGLAVLPDGLDDERVAFPPANGIAHPGRLRILRERPAVGEDLPVDGARFVQEQHQVRRLHDLEAIGNVVLLRNAGRPAARAGMILAVGLDPLLVDRLRPRLQRHVARFQVGGEVEQVLDRVGRHPEPRQVRLAVSGPARRRVQVDFAVGGPRHVLPGVRLPLRACRRGHAQADHAGNRHPAPPSPPPTGQKPSRTRRPCVTHGIPLAHHSGRPAARGLAPRTAEPPRYRFGTSFRMRPLALSVSR